MILSYYLKSDSEAVHDQEFLGFQLLHEDTTFKKQYEQLKKQPLITNLFLVETEADLPETVTLEQLPVVEVDQEIIKINGLLTLDEISELLDIGITLQIKMEDES